MASIKECFRSRWGDDGYIVEADFSQLEVIGAAVVSGDLMMKKDILDGIDSHSQSASWLNTKYTYEEILAGYKAEDPFFVKMRKNAKGPRFELQYGAGATSIARNNDLPIEVAQGFIDSYYARYSRLREFQKEVYEEVNKVLVPSGRRTESGMPLMQGQWVSPTGRIYVFQEEEAPAWLVKKTGKCGSISPTQIANYPMQGFATGDIVPEVLGQLTKNLIASNMYGICLPINTVHDSILFDVRAEHVENVGKMIKATMESAPALVKKRFGVEIDLPLKVDVEYGRSWDAMTKLC